VRAIKLETLARINWAAAQRGGAPDVPAADVEVVSGRTSRAQRDSVQPVWNYYVQLLEHQGALAHDPVFGIDV